MVVIRALFKGSTLTRQGERIGVSPPSPELKGALAALKPGLLYAMEDGEVLTGQDLLRLERLALLLLGGEPPASAWCTIYPKGERVLLVPGQLRGHMIWRVHNVDPPARLHLATTTGTLTMDLRHPVEALMRARVSGLEIILAGPVKDLVEYLTSAARVMVPPDRLEVEGPGGGWSVKGWREGLQALTIRKGVA